MLSIRVAIKEKSHLKGDQMLSFAARGRHRNTVSMHAISSAAMPMWYRARAKSFCPRLKSLLFIVYFLPGNDLQIYYKFSNLYLK
jgi:hypothetical protein